MDDVDAAAAEENKVINEVSWAIRMQRVRS